MVNANTYRAAIAPQAGLGQFASSGFTVQNVTSDNLSVNKSFGQSAEITGDRAIEEHFDQGESPQGTIGLEAKFHSLARPIEGTLQKAFREYPYAAGTTITGVTAADDTYVTTNVTWAKGMIVRAAGFAEAGNNHSGEFVAQTGSGAGSVVSPDGAVDETPGAGASLRAVGFTASDLVTTADGLQTSGEIDFTELQLERNQALKLAGLTLPALNTFVSIDEVTDANNLKLKDLPAGWTAGASIATQIRAYTGDVGQPESGNGRLYYTYQRQFGGLTDGEIFYDTTFDSLSVNMSTKAPITAQANVKATSADIVPLIDATPTPQAASRTMTGSRSIARISEGGAALTAANLAKSMTLNFQNGLSDIDGLSFAGPADFSPGDQMLTVQMPMRFSTWAKHQKHFDGTASSLLVPFGRLGQGYVVVASNLTVDNSSVPVPGRNQEVEQPFSLMAAKDAVAGTAYTVTKLWYYT